MAKAKQGHHIGFKKLTRQLAAKGARNPKALAAYIGDEKYGKAGMRRLAMEAHAKKHEG